MDEIEKRLSDSQWDIDMACKVQKTRTFRRNRAIAAGSSLSVCLVVLTATLFINLAPEKQNSGFITTQVYGTVENVYSDYERSSESMDGYILTVLDQRW